MTEKARRAQARRAQGFLSFELCEYPECDKPRLGFLVNTEWPDWRMMPVHLCEEHFKHGEPREIRKLIRDEIAETIPEAKSPEEATALKKLMRKYED